METRAVHHHHQEEEEEGYLPPLPPRPPKQKPTVQQNFSNLWTKVPQQLQGPVKVILIVLGCVLALVIAGLIGYDAAKSRYQTVTRQEETGRGGTCHRDRPHLQDCSSYYSCQGGRAVLTECPAHHHFDQYKLSCVWIHQSSCGKSSPSPPSPPSLASPTSPPAVSPEVPPSLAQVEAEETRLTSQGEIRQLRSRLATLSSLQVELVRPGRAVNPANTRLVEEILAEKDWDFLFPQRHPAYTYTNFLKAVSKFPAVCHPDSPVRCREVLATMFAHFTQETGGHNPSGEVPEWRQGLHYVEELGCDARDCGYSTNCAGGEWTARAWPCGQSQSGEWRHYHGRGAKQLSYNYNYGQFSAAMYSGNIRHLLDQPDLVKETWLNLASAIWFFATPQPPKPSMLAVIEQDWLPTSTDKLRGLRSGFGLTTNIINGGIECGKGAETQQALNRAGYYREFAKYLKVEVKGELGCGRMKQFSDSGAVGVYWEEDWASKYRCKLVTYQTPYSALIQGDYTKCVRDKFKLNI